MSIKLNHTTVIVYSDIIVYKDWLASVRNYQMKLTILFNLLGKASLLLFWSSKGTLQLCLFLECEIAYLSFELSSFIFSSNPSNTIITADP